jgi:NAD(P)-dependent dehydrogenase (short-subunit alcohol dehydrogenase family)
MAGRLAGKVAIITGGSRGLGQYCAVAYGREGAIVAVAARTETETDPRLPGTIYDTARMVDEAGGQGFPVVMNVGDQASIEAAVAKVIEKYGRIDILMTNAAIQPPGGISTMSPKHFELEFRINVNGPFHCIRAVLPTMLAQGSGNIINISSVAARADWGSHYGATKRAIESLTQGLAVELQDKGIAVNCLKPDGGIDTPGIRYSKVVGVSAPDASDRSFPSPESYIESAILLALQTPATCTGGVFYDSEALERFADAATKSRIRGK